MSKRNELRIGVGKHAGLNKDGNDWYVTIYNRSLTYDYAQGWFATLMEAGTFARKLLSARRPTEAAE